jgi:hypothetical protein
MGGEDFDVLEVEEIHPDERFPEGAFDLRDPQLGARSSFSRHVPLNVPHPHPDHTLFTGVRGREIPRSSHTRSSMKFSIMGLPRRGVR